MVYLTGAWGMGETEPRCYSTNTSPVSTSSSISSPSSAAAAAFIQDHDEEVALHPLNNQVINTQNNNAHFFNYLNFYGYLPFNKQLLLVKQ